VDGVGHPEQAGREHEAGAREARCPGRGLRHVGLGELAADEIGGE
jgi:hypothetical protein